jgi:undecaprenyl-diphosphatase
MAHKALLTLPPSAIDLAIARAAARHANPPLERTLGVVTWLADEHLLLGAAALLWAGTRLTATTPGTRRQADHLACSTVATAVLPHLLKHLVDRLRPDRCVPRLPGRGIPRSGHALNSFPSGHALHLGTLAAALSRWAPPSWRGGVWAGAVALSATRVLLLAHWASDVVAGLAMGAALESAVHRLEAAVYNPSRSSVRATTRASS